MKITKQRLQRIIQEELQDILLEQDTAFNALPALQQAFAGIRDGISGASPGSVTNAQLEELAPHVTKQEQVSKMIGFIKKHGGDAVVRHFKNKAKPAGEPAAEPKAGGSLGKQQGMKAGLKGKYLDAYTAAIQGKTLSREQRQNFIKNFLAKQKAGGV